MRKFLLWAVCFALLLSSCGTDEITPTDAVDTTSSGSDPSFSDDDFDRTVTVVFNDASDASVSGVGDYQTVTIVGNNVTIVNDSSSTEKVLYELGGTASNGFFKLYSNKKQAIVLNNVSISNPAGAAINVQSHKSVYVVLKGSNSLADGSSYSATPADEDEKAAFFSEGQLLFSGSGSLTVTAKGKSGIVSDDYVKFSGGFVSVICSSSCSVSNGDTLKPACIKGKDEFIMDDGSLTLKATGTGAKGISGDGTATFNGGSVSVTVTGSNFGSSGGGWGGNNNKKSVAAKGIKFDGNISINGGTLVVSASKHEGIETKGTLTVTGGEVYSTSSDDAINSASDMTIDNGYICAISSGNDGLDANGNLYINGGVVFAVCTGSNNAEVAVDANTEAGYKLYLNGGILFTCGNLERGSSLSQSCWSSSSWTKNVWYSLNDGNSTYAFKTPSSGGSKLVVSAASKPTVMANVTLNDGVTRCNNMIATDCTVSGGNSVNLSSYSNNSGGSGGGPGH